MAAYASYQGESIAHRDDRKVALLRPASAAGASLPYEGREGETRAGLSASVIDCLVEQVVDPDHPSTSRRS